MNSKPKIGDIVTFEVTEEDYQEALASGLDPEETFSIGKHYGVRGGFAIRKQISPEDWQRIRNGETMVAVRPDTVIVKLAPDVSEAFHTSEEVNEALRKIIHEKEAA